MKKYILKGGNNEIKLSEYIKKDNKIVFDKNNYDYIIYKNNNQVIICDKNGNKMENKNIPKSLEDGYHIYYTKIFNVNELNVPDKDFGLINCGNNCYINSSIQLLKHINHYKKIEESNDKKYLENFFNLTLKYKEENDKNKKIQQKCVDEINKYNFKDLTEEYIIQNINNQNDAADFLKFLYPTDTENAILKKEHIDTYEYSITYCYEEKNNIEKCNKIISKSPLNYNPFIIFNIYGNITRSLITNLMNYKQIIEDEKNPFNIKEYKKETEKCKHIKNDYIYKYCRNDPMIYAENTNFIIIIAKIYETDNNNLKIKKLVKIIPDKILSIDNKQINNDVDNIEFTPVSIISHGGNTINSGHYINYSLRKNPDSNKNEWFQYNDNNVYYIGDYEKLILELDKDFNNNFTPYIFLYQRI
jgi:uncharacterized UBP type Zn finger protein